MSHATAFLLLSLSVAVLAAFAVAAAALALAWMRGAHPADAIIRASTAFAGSLTLAVLVISLLLATAR